MHKVILLVNFIGRGVNWGFTSGSLLGVIFYFIVFNFDISIFMIYGMLFGASLGIIVGGMNGIALFILTIFLDKPNLDVQTYRFTALIINLIASFLCSFVVTYSMLSFYAVAPISRDTVVLCLLVATMAALAAGYAIRAVSGWYLAQRALAVASATIQRSINT